MEQQGIFMIKTNRIIKFTIPGEIKAQARPRYGRYGQIYNPSNKDKRRMALFVVTQVRRPLLQGRVSIRIGFHFRHKKRIDIDNAVKILLDAIQGIVYKNDKQVYEIYAKAFENQERERTKVLISAFKNT